MPDSQDKSPPPVESTGVESTGVESTGAESTGAESAGCFPAVLAATVLMGIVLFLSFGFAGYLIFQKRGDLAARTLRGSIIPELSQSRLDPETKQAVILRLESVAKDIEDKKIENWQSGGLMNRLVRSPLLRWGDLIAVDAWAAEKFPADEYAEFHKQVSRFFRAAELDRAIAIDLQDLLATVSVNDPATALGRLKSELLESDVREVAVRAKIVAARAEIPDRVFEKVSLPDMVDRLIEIGMSEGPT